MEVCILCETGLGVLRRILMVLGHWHAPFFEFRHRCKRHCCVLKSMRPQRRSVHQRTSPSWKLNMSPVVRCSTALSVCYAHWTTAKRKWKIDYRCLTDQTMPEMGSYCEILFVLLVKNYLQVILQVLAGPSEFHGCHFAAGCCRQWNNNPRNYCIGFM